MCLWYETITKIRDTYAQADRHPLRLAYLALPRLRLRTGSGSDKQANGRNRCGSYSLVAHIVSPP
ncbi:MAG: hypothetical protein ACN6OP_28300, partial [Pseudomonadales bacterium]